MARIIISLIFLAAAIMVFFAWAKPNFEEVKSLSGQQKAFTGALASSKELRTIRDDILSEYNSISQGNLERLNKLLPSQMEAIKLILEIENIVKNHNLSLKNIDVKKPAKEQQKAVFGEQKKNFDKIPMSIAVAGSYASFISFLDDLEKNLSLIDIDQLSFSAGEADSYEFNIRASTYWEK